MLEVVVAPHALFTARIADTRDHRRVVELVRIDDAMRQQLAERAERRLVRDIARGEEQRAFLAVQIGQLGREVDVIRSEERRVGKEGVSTCRSRWSGNNKKKKRTK